MKGKTFFDTPYLSPFAMSQSMEYHQQGWQESNFLLEFG
jgi:hypothetical protein